MGSYKDGGTCPAIKAETASVYEASDDHTLMADMAHGDGCALDALSKRHLKSMVGVAQRILGNAAEADEVVQEGFLRLWTYAPRWNPDGTGSVRTWLSRVITNLCLDRLRRRRSVPLDDVEELEDLAPGAFEQLAEEDRRRVVEHLLNALPERQRIAVVLSYYEELSGKEVALAMELSEGAVESLLVRAKRGLRDMMLKQGLVWEETI